MRRATLVLLTVVSAATPLVRAQAHDHEHDENKWPGTMTDADITCVDDSVDECACTENGERDLDCCAEELAAGCLPGYTMTRLTDAGPCWPNTLAYSTCCTPIAGYFEDDASGTGPGFPPRGEGTHMYKADGSTNEPPEWQASYIAQSNSTDGWCASEPHYAEKCDVECMETSIAFNEGFAALIMAWILGNLLIVCVVTVGCWGGGIYCMQQNKKQGYEPQPILWLVACLLFWCGCWMCTFVPFICKNEKTFYDPPQKPVAAVAAAMPVATATAVVVNPAS